MGWGFPKRRSLPRPKAAILRSRPAALRDCARQQLPRLVIVSDDTHLFRIHAICAARWIECAYVAAAPCNVEGGNSSAESDSARDSELYGLAASCASRNRDGAGLCDSLEQMCAACVREDRQGARANAAALPVERKLTASLLSQPRRSSVAPSKLSKKKPKMPPALAHGKDGSVASQAQMSLQVPTTPAATIPAIVPPKLIAPSVPGSARRSVVIMRGRLPRT